MPSRNIVKTYAGESYYHVYNRGVNKRPIFKDVHDYAVFLNLLKRYLDCEPKKDVKGREYDWLHDRLQLLAFCLMPNHFHLLIYQEDDKAMTQLLRAISGSYTRYFNQRYKRVGPLFQSNFKASLIAHDNYLLHISRYIHLNPRAYKSWEFSSLPYYLHKKSACWIQPEPIKAIFASEGINYKRFLADYRDYKKSLAGITSALANH